MPLMPGAEPFAPRAAGRTGVAAVPRVHRHPAVRCAPGAEHLADARAHASRCPGCPGHGTTVAGVPTSRHWEDWYAEVERHLALLAASAATTSS